jgi:NAD(P)H-dependent FMN reductase
MKHEQNGVWGQGTSGAHRAVDRRVRILGISGSLQERSANTALLEVARAAADPATEVDVYRGIESLPHFNPDLDGADPPPPVSAFRSVVGAADGVLIATPEYAHGVPGALKDALDWLVGSGELYEKPVVIVNAAAIEERGAKARGELERTLRAQGAQILASATVIVPPRTDPRDVPSARDAMVEHLARFRAAPLRTASP